MNTHKGLFCYNRLPFGVAPAPAIFQRRMETVLAGLPAVQVYLDDVLIAERQDGNDSVLRNVLHRLQENCVKQKAEKCHIRKDSIVYLGHRIDKDGLHPLEKNLAALVFRSAVTGTVERRRSALLGSSSHHTQQGSGAHAIRVTPVTPGSIGDEKTDSDVVLVARVGCLPDSSPETRCGCATLDTEGGGAQVSSEALKVRAS
nr:uncharacterized protein K02A2.6-like [Rhipicephalus microplus]